MELFLLMVGWGLLLPGLVPHTLALQLYWPDWASEERRNVFLMDLPHLYMVIMMMRVMMIMMMDLPHLYLVPEGALLAVLLLRLVSLLFKSHLC